ncbi:MAG: phage holin family protein [Clostridiales bacterium]|nr:phage holin family protein [Clostridiales bacterium]
MNVTEATSGLRPSVVKWLGAAAGWAAAWWAGLPAIAQALLMVQAADVLTGLLCALTGKSPKSESGRVSSRALSAGVVKKGLEWLAVCICIHVGGALEMNGIGGAAMTYMIATELVSLMENLETFGLDIPILRTILDVAQGKRTQDGSDEG